MSYEILRPLGSGGMATVYLATMGGRRVAVKKLHPFIAEDPTSLAVLQDEARIVASIAHPNVVAVIDVLGEEDGAEPAIVMDWVEGVNLATLASAVAKTGLRMPLDVVAAIGRDLLAGLHAAHEAGIIHRDVSPENILVGFDGVVRVIDFGVAKAAWRNQQTEAGSIKGKLGYLAPEQLDGKCARSADVYGAGAVIWELLTGKRLRDAAGEGVQVLVQILCGTALPPSHHEPGAAAFDAVVGRALERAPEDRFATALAMTAELEHACGAATAVRLAAFMAEVLGASPDSAPALVCAAPLFGLEPVLATGSRRLPAQRDRSSTDTRSSARRARGCTEPGRSHRRSRQTAEPSGP